MVTQEQPQATEPDATSVAEATPPVVEVEDGDAPLIPPDTPAVSESPQPETTESQGPEATEAGAATAETEEAAEQGDTEESSTASGLDALRVELEREKSRRSGLDSQLAQLQKTAQEAITQSEQARLRAEQQLHANQIEIDAARLMQQRAQQYLDQGHTEEAASAFAAREVELVKAAYGFEQQARQAQAELEKVRSSEKTLSSRQAAIEMATKHGVSNDDLDLLIGATSVEQMESWAKRLGTAAKAESELSQTKQAAVPAGQKLDSGGDGGPGVLTDDQKLNDLNTPLEEVEAILIRRGEHPFKS